MRKDDPRIAGDDAFHPEHVQIDHPWTITDRARPNPPKLHLDVKEPLDESERGRAATPNEDRGVQEVRLYGASDRSRAPEVRASEHHANVAFDARDRASKGDDAIA